MMNQAKTDDLSFDELLLKLKQEYISSFDEKIPLYLELLKQSDFAELEEHFHKLKGSGQTHGLSKISELGALGEAACAKPDQETAEIMNTLILDLKAFIDGL